MTAPERPDIATLRALAPSKILRITAGSPITIDGWVFPKAPLEVWREHGEARVPFIVGTNAIEFAAASRESAIQQLKAFYGPRAGEVAGLYGLEGPARLPDPLYGDGLDQLGSDAFRLPSILLGAWHSEGGAPTWQYELDRAIPPHPRVGHSGDLPYVFGAFHVPGNLTGDYGPADHALSAEIQDYWTHLASAGDPNKAGMAEWPAYDSRARAYIAFTREAGTEVRHGEREGFLEEYRQALTRSLDSSSGAAPTAPDAVRNAEKAARNSGAGR